jgi:hypothetical protein
VFHNILTDTFLLWTISFNYIKSDCQLIMTTWTIYSVFQDGKESTLRLFYKGLATWQCPDQNWTPPSLLSSGYRGSFPGVKRGRGVTLTTHTYLTPMSRVSRSYNASPPWRLYGVSGTDLLYSSWTRTILRKCFYQQHSHWRIKYYIIIIINNGFEPIGLFRSALG